MRLRARLFARVAVALALGGCGPRIIVQPSSAEAKHLNYVYFVEQEAGKDSRLKRCEILPDNRVDCAVEFDLD
jgi:hypothetical protein